MFKSFFPAAEHLCVFACNLHVSELRNIKGFAEVKGEKTIVNANAGGRHSL